MNAAESAVAIRPATDDDVPAIVALAGDALGWDPTDPNLAFFRWKHLDNPFGRSFMWLAEIEGVPVGFRAFLRWRFVSPHGAVRAAVRAVDTATASASQGRGIFSALTRHALAEVSAQGIEFVFNTPNDQSRPGYLKMGWVELGRLPVSGRIRRPWRLRRARRPATKWSIETDAGCSVEAIVDDAAGVEDAVGTVRSADYLRWRYGFGPLGYRGFVGPDGSAVFRLRARGGAVECTVCELTGGAATVRAVGSATDADYVLVAGRSPGAVALPRVGPIVTVRSAAGDPPAALDELALSLGDVELF